MTVEELYARLKFSYQSRILDEVDPLKLLVQPKRREHLQVLQILKLHKPSAKLHEMVNFRGFALFDPLAQSLTAAIKLKQRLVVAFLQAFLDSALDFFVFHMTFRQLSLHLFELSAFIFVDSPNGFRVLVSNLEQIGHFPNINILTLR